MHESKEGPILESSCFCVPSKGIQPFHFEHVQEILNCFLLLLCLFDFLQSMVTSLTGVPGDLVVLLALVVLKCDLGTAPIHHRSTMALTAKDLETKPGHVMFSLVQVKGLFFDKFSIE